MEITTAKDAIRRKALEQRRAMSPTEVQTLSAAIAERVWALDEVRAAPALLTYVDSKDNEVQTRELIQRALKDGKEVLVPRSRPDGSLRWSAISRLDDLVPGRFGILEPRIEEECKVRIPSQAPCLVPGIAFTRSCHRLGYGHGFFDRLLTENNVFSAGLAFDSQILARLPVAPHDVALDFVVTETNTYRRIPLSR